MQGRRSACAPPAPWASSYAAGPATCKTSPQTCSTRQMTELAAGEGLTTQGQRMCPRRAREAVHAASGPQPISRARLAGRATLLLSALGQPCDARAWLVAHSSA